MHYVTGGESHGPALTAIVSGVPAGLIISEKQINADLARRQSGYGRGGRQQIERDQVRILSGVRFGRTLGTPVTLQVANRDWENWTDRMAAFGEAPEGLRRETTPRPGHADLLGVIKTDTDDCRDILERASARETAARVAASGIAREFLAAVGVEVYSYVRRIGSVEMSEEGKDFTSLPYNPLDIETSDVRARRDFLCATRRFFAFDEPRGRFGRRHGDGSSARDHGGHEAHPDADATAQDGGYRHLGADRGEQGAQ